MAGFQLIDRLPYRSHGWCFKGCVAERQKV